MIEVLSERPVTSTAYARFTGRGRGGGAVWRPQRDGITLACGAG